MENKNYYFSTNGEKKKFLEEFSKSVENANHSVAGFYTNLEDNISVRPPFSRRSYERFRPGEAVPTKDSEIMLACRDSYQKVGLIRSVVDLMSEMAIEGLTIVSTNENIESFFKSWLKKSNLIHHAEKFANYFIVEGNVTIRRKVGVIDTPEIRRMKREKTLAQSLKIPIDYIFYDPSSIELIGGEAALFSGIKRWAIKINSSDFDDIRRLLESEKNSIMKSLPKEIRQLIESSPENKIRSPYGDNILIPIDSDELYVAHYKKKDSDIWAKSFIYSILHDVIYNEKLRLAKISALDSWYNAVRLWKLGDHKEEILPDIGSINKLANILENHTGGTMDIIWDSMIDYQQFFPPVEKLQNFEENYESMLLGLGIHKSLIGGDENPAAAASAFIGLRNVMKRIDSVRRAITAWIEHEIDIICDTLGFRIKPKVKFNVDDLFEQSSYFRLLVDLNDRNVISNRTIVEKIGEMYDIELERLRNEQRLRDSGDQTPKFTPFIQSYIPEENRNILNIDSTSDSIPTKENYQPPQTNRIGRPPGAKDIDQRKRRFDTIAELNIAGNRIQEKLDDVFDNYFMKKNNVKNKRMLTSNQKLELDQMKIKALSQVENMKKIDFSIDDFDFENYDEAFVEKCNSVTRSFGQNITLDEVKSIRSSIFAEKILGDL